MKPGRELDALVAEKVMGIKKVSYNPEHHHTIGLTKEQNSEIDWSITCPKYSTDISAAWLVVEKLRDTNFMVVIQGCKGLWQIRVEKRAGYAWERASQINECESAPHAIALASLKAVGHEV